MAYSEGAISDDQVLDILGAIDRKVIFDLSSALLTCNVEKALKVLDGVYNYGHDLKRLTMQMVEHFRHLLIVKMGHGVGPLVDVPAHELAFMEQQVANVSLESLNQVFTTLFQAETDIRLSPQPKIALEMLFIKLAQLKPVVSFDQIIKKLDHLAQAVETGQGIARGNGAGQDFDPEPPPPPEGVTEPDPKGALPENLTQIWQQLLTIIGKECPTLVPTVEQATLTTIGTDFIEITVTGNSFHTVRLRDKKSMAALQRVCNQLFQRKMKIKILESKKGGPQKGQHKESDRERRLKKEALDHPLVTDALEVFKGRVVDVKLL
jgi:DNA polymerase-3 subunit gamma/tau